MLPLIAVSAGDPGGIGPEVAVKALRRPAVRARLRAVLVGDPGSLRRAGWGPRLAPLLPVPCAGPARPRPSAAQGAASFRAARLAARLALDGHVRAAVTAPVSKEAWALAGTGFTGHTELLRELAGVREVAMMFEAGTLRAALVTEHIPLRSVPAAATPARVRAVAALLRAELERRGLRRPRLAVCALNPHAGEGGLLGTEEARRLAPGLRRIPAARRPAGPVPADAAWAAQALGRFDALVCLHHDQALAPLKAVSPFGIVHRTLGLPFVRTSPAHGTASDLAGRGRADASAMEAALLAGAA